MSESISNVVASLKNVRNDYQSKLTSVPQYAAFLDVQALIEKVESALGVSAAGEGSSQAKAIVQTLQNAQAQFTNLLETVREYSALKSIDKLIAELDAATVSAPKAEIASEAIGAASIAPPEPDMDRTDAKVTRALDEPDADGQSVPIAPINATATEVAQQSTHVATSATPSVAERPSSDGFPWQASAPSVSEQAPTTNTEHPPRTPEGTERAA